jgi:hypothetical protein
MPSCLPRLLRRLGSALYQALLCLGYCMTTTLTFGRYHVAGPSPWVGVRPPCPRDTVEETDAPPGDRPLTPLERSVWADLVARLSVREPEIPGQNPCDGSG